MKEDTGYYHAQRVEMALDRKVEILNESVGHIELLLKEMGKEMYLQQKTIKLLQRQVRDLKQKQ